MLNHYKQLTLRYLVANKKRTLLTVVGIILSVALMSSIGLFIKGMQAVEVEKERYLYGSYHLLFSNLSEKVISQIIHNPKVKRYGFFSNQESTPLSNNITSKEIVATNKALELLPYHIKTGRFPQNSGEIAVEAWVLKELHTSDKIGESIKIGQKSYHLSGILEPILSQSENQAILLTFREDIAHDQASLLVEIDPSTNIRTAINELEATCEKGQVQENSSLLFRLGAAKENDRESQIAYQFAFILIGIVSLSTIAVIFNSFHIGVVERIREFGLLRAVGATPKQIRLLVFREAVLMAVIGIPSGLFIGVLSIQGIITVFQMIGDSSKISVILVVDPLVMWSSAGLGLVTILISTLLPAFYAGKISPLSAISNRSFILKETVKRHKLGSIWAIFGFEGTLAAKNTQRNLFRYRITVLSIAISVTLFVVFKSLIYMLFTFTDTPNESVKINFSISRSDVAIDSIDNSIADKVIRLNAVDKVYKIREPFSFNAYIDQRNEVKKVKELDGFYWDAMIGKNPKTALRASCITYGNEELHEAKRYLVKGNIDIEKLNAENGIILINRNKLYNPDKKKWYLGPITNMQVGDKLELQPAYSQEYPPKLTQDPLNKVKVLAILSNLPFNSVDSDSTLNFITTESVAKRLTGKDALPIDELNITIKDQGTEVNTQEELKSIIKVSSTGSNLFLVNYSALNRIKNATILMMQILIYGFVVVVSLIGGLNIMNTMTTNVILRKREFAILKSIGLSQRGLKKIIILEGFLYSITGSIYGFAAGLIFSYVLYNRLDLIRGFNWQLPWDAMLIAGIAAVVLGYVSVLAPFARLKKENLIEVIKKE